METLVILMSIGALGNYLSKGSKAPRPQAGAPSSVSPNDEPTGEKIIYEQNRVAQVEKEMLHRAQKKYQTHIQQQFPLDHAQPMSVFAKDNFADVGFPAPLNALPAGTDSVEATFQQQRQELAVQQPSAIVPADPMTGKNIVPPTTQDVVGGPLFRNQAEFKQVKSNLLEGFSGPVSELSGLPWDGQHNNMQPRGRHHTVTDDYAQVRLERFSGIDLGQGTFMSKNEMPAIWNGPQDTQRKADVDLVGDRHSRAQFAADNRSQFNYQTPIKGFRDAPQDFSRLNAPTKNIDELFPRRGVSEFEGRWTAPTAQGQRAMVGSMTKDYVPRDYQGRELVGNRHKLSGLPVVPVPEVRDNRYTTSTYEQSWQGPRTTQLKQGALDQASDAFAAGAQDIVRRKTDVYTLPVGVASGPQRHKTTGVFNLNTTEKGLETKYFAPGYTGKGQTDREGISAPDATIKQMLDVSQVSGKGNRVDSVKGGHTEVNFDLPMTNKAMNPENKYMGPGFRNRGQGIRQHGIVALSTLKEMLHQEHFGPASNLKLKDKVNGELVDGLGVPNILEDYITNANRIQHQKAPQELEDFAEASTKDLTHKLDFGGRMGTGKHVGPESSMLCGEAAVDPDRSAPGRLTVGVQYSAEERPCVDVTLKKEGMSEVHFGGARPTNVVLGHPGIQVKTQNMEAINPRLDPDTRITSDLFPWLNCNEGTPVDTGLEGVETIPTIDTNFAGTFLESEAS